MEGKETSADTLESLTALMAKSVLERSRDVTFPYRVKSEPKCTFCQKNKQVYLTDHEFEHPEPTFIKRLPASVAALSYEQDYLGRSVVVLRDHETSLSYLLEHKFLLYVAFMEDVSAVADAIYKTLNPLKINYSVLMNKHDHFHMHLIPRYSAENDRVHLPPVFRGTTEMDPAFDYRSLALRIRHNLPKKKSLFRGHVEKMINAGLPP